MSRPALRESPVRAALERLKPTWGEIAGMQVPLHFGDPAAERAAAGTLALCDISALERLTVKGSSASDLLARQGLAVPDAVYAVQAMAYGGLLIRTGGSEYFLESGPRGQVVRNVAEALAPGGYQGRTGVYTVPRQDACFLLSGSGATEVLAQTCGIDFRESRQRFAAETPVQDGAAGPFIVTRVAGVSCGILPRRLNGLPVYQLWLDFSYGPYLWDQLLTIVRELNGVPVGVSCFFPE